MAYKDPEPAYPDSGEIVITAVVGRVSYGQDGTGSALKAAFDYASSYVADMSRDGEPWDAEAHFYFNGAEYTVSGKNV